MQNFKFSIVFTPEGLLPHMLALKQMGEAFTFINSHNIDEFTQSFLQSGKFIILFADPQKAVKFISAHNELLSSLVYSTFVCRETKTIFSLKSEDILNKFKVKVFSIDEASEMLGKFTEFFNETDQGFDIDSLEFFIPPDEKKAEEKE